MTATLEASTTDSISAAAVLAGNKTAQAVWRHTHRLSVLNPTAGQRRELFYRSVKVTPLLRVQLKTLPTDLQDSGYNLFAKFEAQKSGAYKQRGATSALMNRPRGTKRVVVASTGNHANGVAVAASVLDPGLEVTAECAKGTASAKIENMLRNGVTVHDTHDTLDDALVMAEKMGQRPGTLMVHPYNQLDVIGGQGTITCETVDQLLKRGFEGARVTFIFPAGGGGIGAGNAVAAKLNWPDAEVRICQMEGAEGVAKALQGMRLDPATLDKSCDGAAVPTPGELPMRILSDPNFVDAVDVVTKAEVGEAMAVASRTHQMPEPAGALAMAAALRYMRQHPLGSNSSRPHVVVPVTSGVVVTPEKVREFMDVAVKAGLLTEHQAAMAVSLV